jgi:N-acetylglucosamine kinase-like BadF-type ATPase
MATVLGLDIGGSGTRGRLVVDGSVASETSAGSANPAAAGEEVAEANLRSLLGALRSAHPGVIDVVCAGAAGSGAAPTRAWLTRRLADLAGAAQVSVVDDGELVLPAAGYVMGIAVVCGTGSIVHGRGPGGSARAGGWGWLLGDEGGGYPLVRGALRTLLARRDAGKPAGPLGDALIGDQTLDELLADFYADPRPERWAAHAPAVLACGDAAVAPLVDAGARAVVAAAAPLARRLGLEQAPVVLAGGLAAESSVRAALETALRAALPGWPIELLREPPVTGAVALAFQMAG